MSPEDSQRYSKQLSLIAQEVEVYESEKEEDSEEVRGKRFADLILLMQQVRDVQRILGFTGRENVNFLGLLEMG